MKQRKYTLAKFKSDCGKLRATLCQPGEKICGILKVSQAKNRWLVFGLAHGYLRKSDNPNDRRYDYIYWTEGKGETLKEKITLERERRGKMF